MNLLMHCLWSTTLVTCSSVAFAALPVVGLWSIGDELNGQPGRDIQIDRQDGETVIASYFGYRADGSAVFYQAAGKITDGKTLNADLIEYKGGTAIGGSPRDATETRTLGSLQAVFSTSSSGTITLPGESPKAFSRFVFEDHRARLNNTFEVTEYKLYEGQYSLLQTTRRIRVGDNSLIMEYFDPIKGTVNCTYKGDLMASGTGFSSKGELNCSEVLGGANPPNARTVEDLKVDEHGVLSGVFRDDFLATHARLMGVCVQINPSTPETSKPCTPSQLGLSVAAD